MKKLINRAKMFCSRFGVMMVTGMMLTVSVLADDGSNMFENVYGPIVKLLNSLLGPLLAIVGALGTLYCVLLGVKYAKAEEPQDREKAKSHLKNAIIGFALIFVLILALNLLLPVMKTWVDSQLPADQKIFSAN